MLYKLILVGKPIHDEFIGAYRIICHFQPWLVAQNKPASEEILSHAVNSTFAGTLICGTLWALYDKPDRANHILPTDYKSFTINSSILYARRIKDLINPEALHPSNFWKSHNDTWVICINSGDTKIIIPYFELLRIFFYKVSRRLTDFIFSMSPIDSLCSPVAFPDKSNSLTARLCIATTECTSAEALFLGSLLFDPQFCHAFNASQSYWRSAISGNNFGLLDNANILNIGNFGNSAFNANGHYFSYNNERYFWAHEIEVIKYDYKFDNLLYYPLKDNTNRKKANQAEQLTPDYYGMPEYPDSLQETHQHSARSEIRCCYPTPAKRLNCHGTFYTTTNRQWAYAIRKKGMLPLVVRRLPWAKLISRSCNIHFSSDYFLAKPVQILDKFASSQLLSTQNFRKLISKFKSRHYAVKSLVLNNPHQVFGKGLSILPINNFPPLPIAPYQQYIKQFHCIEVNLTYAFLYISQPFPETNPELIIVFIKQCLTRPATEEWNALLSHITPIHSERDLKPFYKKISHVQVRQKSSNTALLAIPVPSNIITAEFCIDLTGHIADKFRRRLQFLLATSLKYPKGVTPEQQKKIIYLSSYVCRAPDPLWQERIAQLWREMTNRRY